MNGQGGRGMFHRAAQDMDGYSRDYPRGMGSSAHIAARDSEIGSNYAEQREGAFASSSLSSNSFSTAPERGFAVPSENPKRGIRGGFPRPTAVQAQSVPSVNRGFQSQGQVCENSTNSSHNTGFGSYNSQSSLPQHTSQTERSDLASFDQYSAGLRTFDAYMDPISHQVVTYGRSYNEQPRRHQNRETVQTGGFNTDDQYDHESYMQSLNHVQGNTGFDSDAQVETTSAVPPEFIPLDTHPIGLATFDSVIDPVAQRQINYSRGFDVEHRNQRAQGPTTNHQHAPENDRHARRATIIAEIQMAKIRQAYPSSRRGRPTGRAGRSRGGHQRHTNNGRSARMMPSKTNDNGDNVVADRPILVGDAVSFWNSLSLTVPSTSSSREQRGRQVPSSTVAIANLLKADLTKDTLSIDKCDQNLLESTDRFMSMLEGSSIHLDAESLSLLFDDTPYPPQLRLRAAQQMPRPVIIDGCAVAVAYDRRFASLWKGKTRNAFFHKDRILPTKPLVLAAIHFIARGHKVVIVLPEFYMEPYIAAQNVCKVDDLEAFNTMRALGLIRFIDPLTEPVVVDFNSRIKEFVRDIHGCFFSHPDIKFSYNYKENNSAQEEEGLLMEGTLDQQKIQKAEENSDERMMTICFGGPQKTMYVVRQFSLYAGLSTESKDKTNYRYVSEQIVLFYSENDGDQHNYGKRMEQQITFYEQVVQTLSLCGLHKISTVSMRCIQKILLVAIKAKIHLDEIKQFVDKYSERSGPIEQGEKEEELAEEGSNPLFDCETPLDIVVHDPVESLVDAAESLTTEEELLDDMDPLIPTNQ